MLLLPKAGILANLATTEVKEEETQERESMIKEVEGDAEERERLLALLHVF